MLSSTAAYCPSFASSTFSLTWIGVRTHPDHPFHLLLRRRTGNVGNAKTAGLENDLGLSDSQWTWVLNSFYICYVLFEWTTILWKLLPAHIYVAMLCIWYVIPSHDSYTRAEDCPAGVRQPCVPVQWTTWPS